MRFLHTLVLAFFAAHLFAVPARFNVFRALMADGTYEQIRLCGDGFSRFYVSEDGYVVEKSDEGNFYIKTAQRPSDFTISTRSIGSIETAPISSTGSPKIPVILVNFSDEKFSVAETDEGIADYFDKFCNGTMDGTLYTGAGSSGAVRDYFAQQSDSVFLPEFVIIGPITLSQTMAYYGQNSNSTTDVNFKEFCSEALRAAIELVPEFEEEFDNDGNGEVDLAFFIYAGLPESDQGVTEDAIWPKEMITSMKVDDVTFSVMGCCSELSASSVALDTDGNYVVTGTMNAGIGTMCHELAHSLGLPDEYDTNYVALGMSYWSLMDSGNYCNNGKTPCGLTGYERDFLGWRTLEILDEPTTIVLHPLEDGGKAYKIINDANEDEYYVLENRYTVGWDRILSRLGHGMLVVHVDYNSKSWTNNKLNTSSSHQRMTIIPANNNYVGPYNASSSSDLVSALGGQPYPGTSENTSLTDYSTPASTVFTGNYMSKPLTSITETSDGEIIVKFMARGQLDTPTGLTCNDLTSNGFTLSWNDVSNASAYKVEVYGVTNEGESSEDKVFSVDSVWTSSINISIETEYAEYACVVTALADDYEDSPTSDYLYVALPANAISSIEIGDITKGIEIYSLNGIMVGCSIDALDNLEPGIYIVRSAGKTVKTIVK